MEGVLVVDKPAGMTSHDVVRRIRRALKISKVGHGGTLDPAATGVLPLFLGRATRLSRYATGSIKAYRGTATLGVQTDTYDGEGEVKARMEVTCNKAQILQALADKVGDQVQVPPMYSAKKIDGKKLCDLARKGIEVARKGKEITIFAIDNIHIDLPEVHFDVRCSAGTYVRVIAHELGEALGCGAHLSALRRTHSGPFGLQDAHPLETILENPNQIAEYLLPLDRTVMQMPSVHLPTRMVRSIRFGQPLRAADLRVVDMDAFEQSAEVALRCDADEGALVGIARADCSSAMLKNLRRDDVVLRSECILQEAS